MKSGEFILNCKPALHFRPIMTLTNMAEIFTESRIFIVHCGNRFRIHADGFLALTTSGIKDQALLELQVEGKDEDIAFRIMKELFQNLDMLPFEIPVSDLKSLKDKKSFDDSYNDAAVGLFYKFLAIINDSKIENQKDFSLKIKAALNISDSKTYKIKAKFNYKKGMHLLPSTLLPSLQHYFDSSVRLLYSNENKELDSIDMFKPFDLLTSHILDGKELTIVAEGIDCEKAAHSVKNILENMQNIMEKVEALKQDSVTEKERLLKEYFAYNN